MTVGVAVASPTCRRNGAVLLQVKVDKETEEKEKRHFGGNAHRVQFSGRIVQAAVASVLVAC